MAAHNSHSWQANAAFPHQDIKPTTSALGSQACGVLNTGCSATLVASVSRVTRTGTNQAAYVDVEFRIRVKFPRKPSGMSAHLTESNRRIRGQVHVRPNADLCVSSPEEIYLPMYDAMIADGADEAEGVLPLRIPLHALTPDALMSFSYYYDRHPPSPLAGDQPSSGAYLSPRGFCIYGGRMLLSIEDLVRGPWGPSAAAATAAGPGLILLGKFAGEIHAVGLDECCERRAATPLDLLATLHVSGFVETAAAAERLQQALHAAPVNHVHMLRDIHLLDDMSHRLEKQLVAELGMLGPAQACPEAVRLFGRDTTDVLLVPAAAFCMVPSSSDPRNPTAATYAAWLASAILSRELGSLSRFSSTASPSVERLLGLAGPIQHTAVLNAEQARIAALQPGVTQENEWAILAASMVAEVTKFASYIADDVVCGSCGASSNGAGDGGRLQLVGTDVSTSWVRSQQSFNGDCDDLARAAYALMQTFRHSTMPLGHELLEAMRGVMQRHYRTYLNNVTAFAPKAGDPQPGGAGYGEIAGDGVRRGVQGHLTCVTLPRKIDGSRVHLINEATTPYCVQHIQNPRPRARRVLERCLRPYESHARAVGLTCENTLNFKYATGGLPFYDHSGTMESCELFGDPKPATGGGGGGGSGEDTRVTTLAAVAPDGGTMRVGVPMDVLLDAAACLRHKVQLMPVGYASERDLQLIASEGLMLPGMVVPRPSMTPGLSTAGMSAEAQRLADLLRGNAMLREHRAAAPATARSGSCELLSFTFRSDRITPEWPERMVQLLAACPCVIDAKVYMQHVYEHLHGVVLTLTIAV